jgi:signal transduction histidine kinase
MSVKIIVRVFKGIVLMLSAPEMSPEFLALCEFQLALLSQSFGASQTVVYLTQSWRSPNSSQLVPVAIYPHSDYPLLESSPVLLTPREPRDSNTSAILPLNHDTNLQLVLPLSYQEIVMGLLVTKRDDRNWQTEELAQIEKIVQTIAIACILERKQVWYENNLIEIEQLRLVEQEQLSNFLHQLRNPITSVKTFGKLLFKRLFAQGENQKIVTGLLRETEHLQDLLKQFEIKTIEPQETTFLLPGNSLTLEPVIITEIIEAVISSAVPIAAAKDIELVQELLDTLPLVYGNTQGIREVMQNLLDNAIKYTPPSGKVKINTLTKQGLVGVGIHDTGCGIPAVVQERIFERHYRGIQEGNQIPGTGLGLAIAKDLVDQMQGKIELISPNGDYFAIEPKGEGTTFILWLPLEPK